MCVTTLCATVESCGLFPSCVLFTFSLPFNSTFLSPSLVLFNDHLPVSPLRLRTSLLSSLLVFFFFCSWRARVASIYVHTQPSAVFQVISIVITKSRAKLGKVLLSPFLLFFFFQYLVRVAFYCFLCFCFCCYLVGRVSAL